MPQLSITRHSPDLPRRRPPQVPARRRSPGRRGDRRRRRGDPADGEVDPAALAELRAALIRHKVVFLRDQHGVTDDDQRAFARLLGPLTKPHPTVAGDGVAILPIDSEQRRPTPGTPTSRSWTGSPRSACCARWCCRPTAAPRSGRTPRRPTSGCIRAQGAGQQPPGGARQPVRLRASAADRRRRRQGAGHRDQFRQLEFETEQPVVRIHPETGEPTLLLGHFVKSFTGLTSTDSAELFALLQRHVTRLENTVRWTWRDGDIAIWDNRATQHYAVADYDDEPRLLHRITVAAPSPSASRRRPSSARATPPTLRSPRLTQAGSGTHPRGEPKVQEVARRTGKPARGDARPRPM